MADAQTAMTQLKEAYGASIIEMTPIDGTPRLRVKKDDLPQVVHYLHTHPNLRGALSLLWAVDHRPREARYELCYLFTLSERKDWLLLCTDLQAMSVCSDPSRRTSMRRNGMSARSATCSV